MTDQEHKDRIVNLALKFLQNRLLIKPERHNGMFFLDKAIYEYLESKGISHVQFLDLDLTPDNLEQ